MERAGARALRNLGRRAAARPRPRTRRSRCHPGRAATVCAEWTLGRCIASRAGDGRPAGREGALGGLGTNAEMAARGGTAVGGQSSNGLVLAPVGYQGALSGEYTHRTQGPERSPKVARIIGRSRGRCGHSSQPQPARWFWRERWAAGQRQRWRGRQPRLVAITCRSDRRGCHFGTLCFSSRGRRRNMGKNIANSVGK
jgi:hypothetical protein